jgi:crotonobetainyl-CoA:carnitine CoA-transferase CaiB-like acyl-CoA transferase
MNAKPEEPVRSPPLEGVRILDMSRLVVGNMMTHVLADMGADVIKIEPPEGGGPAVGAEGEWPIRRLGYGPGSSWERHDDRSGPSSDTA